MSKTIFLVYDDYNSNLYDHADYIGTITAHGERMQGVAHWDKNH